MGTWRRNLTIVVTANYLLAITASELFHNHGGHDESPSRSGDSTVHFVDGHGCPVCQFLAQKPTPTANVMPATLGLLVQEVASPAKGLIAGIVFTAWQSRAPPFFA